MGQHSKSVPNGTKYVEELPSKTVEGLVNKCEENQFDVFQDSIIIEYFAAKICCWLQAWKEIGYLCSSLMLVGKTLLLLQD